MASTGIESIRSRQWILALGMMVADHRANLFPEMRTAGLALLQEEKMPPPSWKALIRHYFSEYRGVGQVLYEFDDADMEWLNQDIEENE